MATRKNRPIHEVVVDVLPNSVLLCETHKLRLQANAVLKGYTILKDELLLTTHDCVGCGRTNS